MKKKVIPLLIAGTVLLSACNTDTTEKSAPATPVVSKADAVAEVNGQYISKKSFDELSQIFAQRSHGQTLPKEKLIEELIQRELLLQDAVNKKLDQTPEVIAQIESARKSILSQAALQNYLQANPVTDEEIQAEYDKSAKGDDSKEYKARHILVKTEQEAKDLIAKLAAGADFATLAKENSTGPSGAQGGDLGWFSSNQMVAPFSEAVIALEDNKFSTEPVQTQFGWHVILREGVRDRTAPPLEAVKAQLEPFLQRQKIRAMLDNLRNQAKVEILIPLTEAKPEPAKVETTAQPEKTQQTTETSAQSESTEQPEKTAQSTEASPSSETTEQPAQVEAVTAPETEKVEAPQAETAPAIPQPETTEEPAKVEEPAKAETTTEKK